MAWVASNYFWKQTLFKLAQGGYLEEPQTGQEATITHTPVIKCPENIDEAGYKCVRLNVRSK